MTLETFFEKFDLFADAPDAVATMRELVLNLALQGRFLADNEKKASSAKWNRVSLESVATIFMGNSPPGESYNERGEGVPLINGPVEFSPGPFGLTVRTKFTSAPTKFCKRGDLLICVRGSTTGRTNIAAFDACIGRGVAAISAGENQAFVNLFLWQRRSMIFALGTGSTFPSISYDDLASLQIDLPPLAEQKRIVAKVDELMALCDRLEAQQQERETRHATLARASLARFAEAPMPANLQFLFHKSYEIAPADLRKSILTLAVQGKLVPQDPNDEPAENLVDRIAAMRHAKKAKQYGPVSSDEVPYEVPFSWAWVRLGNISLTSDSGWSPQCQPEARSGTDWGVLKVSAVTWGVFKPDENKALPPGMASRPDCEVKAGDFLLSRANTEELVARSVVVDQTPPRLMMSDKIVRFTFPDEIERAFINLANTSDPARAYYARNASGTSSSMKNVGREVMCNLPIPLPPLAEQRRIVAKVDELMALVDALETQLAASCATATKLLEALVAELTAASSRDRTAKPVATDAPAAAAAATGRSTSQRRPVKALRPSHAG